MIIGVCGFIGSGKDTVADYLVNTHCFRRESFAATLKDAVSAVFGWDRDMLEGRTRSSREWREQPDAWWSQRLGREITPRWVLQHWGTDLCRAHFHDDIWIASLENKLRNSNAAIRNSGGKIVRVVRGSEPVWYNDALRFNAGPNKIGWALGRHALEKAGIHASEYAWVGTDFDAVLDNNSSVDALYQQITDLVQDHRDATASHS
jgi:hypothetical protein